MSIEADTPRSVPPGDAPVDGANVISPDEANPATRREVQFLELLSAFSVKRAEDETALELRYGNARKAAGQKQQESLAAHKKWLATAEQKIAAEHAEAQRLAQAKHTKDSASAEHQLTEYRLKLDEKFEPARKQSELKRQEVYRQSEAQFDSRKKIAPKQLAEFEQQLDAWKVRMREDRDSAQKLLAKWRLTSFGASRLKQAQPGSMNGDLSALLQERLNIVSESIESLKGLYSPGMAGSWLFKLFWPVLAGALGGGAWYMNPTGYEAMAGGPAIALVLGLGVILLVRSSARSNVGELYPKLCQAATEAETLLAQSLSEARARTAAAQTKLVEQRERIQQMADKQHEARLAEIEAQLKAKLEGPTQMVAQKKKEFTARRDQALAAAEAARQKSLAEFAQRKANGAREIEERFAQELNAAEAQRTTELEALVAWWRERLAQLESLAQEIQGRQLEGAVHQWLADWKQVAGGQWTGTSAIPTALRFGEFRIDLKQIPQGVAQHAELADLTPKEYLLPALAPFPERPSLLFKAKGDGRRAAVEAMQAFMTRMLVVVPPGKLRFTIIDPVGLGENFASIMHLADFNEALVTSRIWTETPHIEQRLADLSEHMENVIQKYLRNEYQNIDEYNREAGEIAEPYRFLVIANFPANFSDAAQKRLLSIAASGSRCGVYTLIMMDTQAQAPVVIAIRDLEQYSNTLSWKDDRFLWKDEHFSKFALAVDKPPEPSEVTNIVTTAGKLAALAGKVELPFQVIAPKENAIWTESCSSILDIPLGRAGATRHQSMKLGRGTSQHVLIAGKTGSGKSTLLHILITNAALRYSPDELQLYLIDFKQGVEFKTYATYELPHARVVAVESDREFGLSVLGRLIKEIEIRADRYREFGVQDLAGYRKADPANPMPRTLLIIDEFQEFFTEDDKVAQDAALALDRLVRLGRAFGIHVLLGSQTLAGAFSVGRSTLSQMAVRIALQCSEADSQLILSEDNSAARLLTRPGEAIYNDSNGMVEGNHPFQIVWLTEEARERYLGKVRSLAEAKHMNDRPRLVFEGNLPAEMGGNEPLASRLAAGRPAAAPHEGIVWLGDAVAIKEPTHIAFRPQSGANLLMVGQNEDAVIGVLLSALISLAAQYPASDEAGPMFCILDGSATGTQQSGQLARMTELINDPVCLGQRRHVKSLINQISVEVERRRNSNVAEHPPIFLVVYGVQKLRELWKSEDDYGFSKPGETPADPGKQFAAILRDGPPQGVYTIAWIDSVNNLNRAWERQTLREFEMRIVFQMSANDSSALIDSPAGGKLGQYRALFHSEETATQEKFRPYRWPSDEWLEHVRSRLGGPSRRTTSVLADAPPASESDASPEAGDGESRGKSPEDFDIDATTDGKAFSDSGWGFTTKWGDDDEDAAAEKKPS